MWTAMRGFSNWIQQHDFIDLSLSGANYTWTNNQEDPMMSFGSFFSVNRMVEFFLKLCSRR